VKQLFVIAHTIRQTDIPALLDKWVKTCLLSTFFIQKEIAELN